VPVGYVLCQDAPEHRLVAPPHSLTLLAPTNSTCRTVKPRPLKTVRSTTGSPDLVRLSAIGALRTPVFKHGNVRFAAKAADRNANNGRSGARG